MTEPRRNQLNKAASLYLRSASEQRVHWQEWGEAAFALARAEGKPVLIDVGAAWCHWCHVMGRESYSDPALAELINELFVSIKVDRDERPEVDARLQAAVAAISGQGGWPLTVIVTEEGEPFFGGTYFAPEERYGRPGLGRVLRSMAQAYQHQRGEVKETAAGVLDAIGQSEALFGAGGPLHTELQNRLTEGILAQYDRRNGGFGAQPKFPHPGALAFLLDIAADPGPHATAAAEAVQTTLRSMANGGICDQLGGGFHRYSVDEHWTVPHFEKMAYDNAELLHLYARAYQRFGDPAFADAASGILGWMDRCLADRDGAGFFASQGAGQSPEEEGDFYTWTLAEAQAALSEEEFVLASEVFQLRAVGHMQHHPAKNVLRNGVDLRAIAARRQVPESEVHSLFDAARRKLLVARAHRPAPPVDRTVYTGWTCLCISAYLVAGQRLGKPEVVSFALQSLRTVLTRFWRPGHALARRLEPRNELPGTSSLPGLLEDYAFLLTAVLDAYEIDPDPLFLDTAESLADRTLSHFWDAEHHGFRDLAQKQSLEQSVLCRVPRRPLQDAPTPGGNGAMASALLRLAEVTGDARYRERARETLEAFAGVVEHLGLSAASYGRALRSLLHGSASVR